MANIQTKNLPAAGSWNTGDNLVGNVFSDATETYNFSKALLDAVYLNATNLNAGTVNIARIPTGTSGSTVPIGNDTRFPASVTGIRVGAGAGSTDVAASSANIATAGGMIYAAQGGINFKVAANTTIYTVPVGKTLYVMGGFIGLTAVSGAGLGPDISIEDGLFNAVCTPPQATDIATYTANTFGPCYQPSIGAAEISGPLFPVAAGGIVRAAVNVATTKTSMTGIVGIYGILV